MTQEEFDFWQRAYLAALAGSISGSTRPAVEDARHANEAAGIAVQQYRTAKATVVHVPWPDND